MYKQLHVHFVGIGGVGMAGIAEVLLNLGYTVSGSDVVRSPLVEHLESLGAKVSIGHDPRNITDDTQVVVRSSAIDATNPEIEETERRAIPLIARAEMLAELMRMQYGIAVGGSHGKTTTTSFVGQVLRAASLDPTVIVGGRLLNQMSGASVGKGQYFVAESDESDGSFCLLRPAIAVVTNIDREHLIHYGSFGALEEAFYQFMSSVPFYGLVVACADDPIVMKLTKRLKRRVVTYGISPEADISATDIRVIDGRTSGSIKVHGEIVCSLSVPIPGVHMLSNALAAIAVGSELGVSIVNAAQSISELQGVARRSELIGVAREVSVIDDYGHHPTEIRATIKAIRECWIEGKEKEGRLVVLFQPHRYTRTKELFSEFLTCFSDADEVVIGDIYSAGEAPIEGISSEVLVRSMQHPNASYVAQLPDALDGLCKVLKPGDVVVTVGAGNVGKTAKILFERLSANEV